MRYQCNNTFYRPEESLHYNLSDIIEEAEYNKIPTKYKKWFTEVGKPLHFYCQNLCGDADFSIDEWNIAFDEVKDKSKIIQRLVLGSRNVCHEQCFDCMSIVGERRLKTKKL